MLLMYKKEKKKKHKIGCPSGREPRENTRK